MVDVTGRAPEHEGDGVWCRDLQASPQQARGRLHRQLQQQGEGLLQPAPRLPGGVFSGATSRSRLPRPSASLAPRGLAPAAATATAMALDGVAAVDAGTDLREHLVPGTADLLVEVAARTPPGSTMARTTRRTGSSSTSIRNEPGG